MHNIYRTLIFTVHSLSFKTYIGGGKMKNYLHRHCLLEASWVHQTKSHTDEKYRKKSEHVRIKGQLDNWNVWISETTLYTKQITFHLMHSTISMNIIIWDLNKNGGGEPGTDSHVISRHDNVKAIIIKVVMKLCSHMIGWLEHLRCYYWNKWAVTVSVRPQHSSNSSDGEEVPSM